MSIATTTALAIGGIATAAGGAASSLAAGSSQAKSAQSAEQLQANEANQALDFQKQEFATQQQNLAPFLATGTQAAQELQGLTSAPGQGLLSNWTGQFNAPTAEQAQATPGYQFQLQQGEQALQNSAASRGNLLSGGTAKALDQYSQGLASTNYQQTYNNALQQYQQSYNQFQNNQANQFNRLSALSGGGQTAATTLGSEGQAAAQNAGNISLTSGQQQGQDIQNAGAATASGYLGVGNAIGTGANNASQSILLNSLLGGNLQKANGGTPINGAGDLLNAVWG